MSRFARHQFLTTALVLALGIAPVTALPSQAQDTPEPDITPINANVANAGPVVTIANATFSQGTKVRHTFTVSDSDGVSTTYWTPVQGFDLEYVSEDTWALTSDGSVAPGTYTFEFYGEDVHGKVGDTVRATITITANTPAPQPTNPAPNPNQQGPVVSIEGGAFKNDQAHTIPFTVKDPQGDRIHQVWWYPIPGAEMRWVEGDKWEIAIAKGAKPGKYTLRVWGIDANNNKGEEARVPLTIVDAAAPAPQPTNTPQPPVNPGVNNGPVVNIDDVTIDNRRQSRIPFTVVDPEGDWVGNVWWQPIPNGTLRHVEGNNWEIVVAPGVRPGNYDLKIWAFDEKGNKGPERTTKVKVVGNAVNAAPVINDGWIRMWAGYPYTYEVPVSDPDNDQITLRIVDGQRPWMRVRGNKLVLDPSRRDVGHFRVTLEADDGKATSRGTYDIYVNRFN